MTSRIKRILLLVGVAALVACDVSVSASVPSLGDTGQARRDTGELVDAASQDASESADAGSDGCVRSSDCPPGFFCSPQGRCFPRVDRDTGSQPDADPQPRPDAMVVVDAGSSPDAGLEPGDDHGDSLAQATDLGGLGIESIGRGASGSIDRSGDEDYFIFRAGLAGTYYVSTRGSTDTFCHLLRADGTEIDRNDDGGSGFNCSIQAYLEEGTYGVRIRHWQRGTGAYALDIRFVPGRVGECGDGQVNAGEQCDDGNRRGGDGCSSQCRNERPPPNPQDDHSNSGAEATEVSVGDRVDGRLEIQRDVDYFVVTSDRDEQVLIGTLGTTNTECTAESVAGDVLATDEDSGQGVNCRMQVDLRAERAVYIRVEGQEPVIAGVYTLYIARP